MSTKKKLVDFVVEVFCILIDFQSTSLIHYQERSTESLNIIVNFCFSFASSLLKLLFRIVTSS